MKHNHAAEANVWKCDLTLRVQHTLLNPTRRNFWKNDLWTNLLIDASVVHHTGCSYGASVHWRYPNLLHNETIWLRIHNMVFWSVVLSEDGRSAMSIVLWGGFLLGFHLPASQTTNSKSIMIIIHERLTSNSFMYSSHQLAKQGGSIIRFW